MVGEGERVIDGLPVEITLELGAGKYKEASQGKIWSTRNLTSKFLQVSKCCAHKVCQSSQVRGYVSCLSTINNVKLKCLLQGHPVDPPLHPDSEHRKKEAFRNGLKKLNYFFLKSQKLLVCFRKPKLVKLQGDGLDLLLFLAVFINSITCFDLKGQQRSHTNS